MTYPTPPASSYKATRNRYLRVGDAWELTLEQWQHLWITGGDFALRGVHCGCTRLIRLDPQGPWSVGNCVIHQIPKSTRKPAAKVAREVRPRWSLEVTTDAERPRTLSVAQWIAELREAQGV